MKKTLSIALSLALLLSSFACYIAVSALSDEDDGGAKSGSVNIEYVSDLGIDKTVNGQFSIGAIRVYSGGVEEGNITPVDPESVAVSSTSTRRGHQITGYDIFAIKTESATGAGRLPAATSALAKFDMYVASNWSPVIVFTAPADGTFSASARVAKSYDQTSANTGVYLKANGEELASKTGIIKGDYTLTTEEAVELKKGDQIILQVKASAGDDVHLISFEVNGNYASCPHELDETGKCVHCNLIPKKYVSDLGVDKTVNGQFSIGAIRVYDGGTEERNITPVDPESVAVSSTSTRRGHKITGYDTFAIKTESATGAGRLPAATSALAKFDMYVASNWSPVIVFTAPADGTFSASARVAKSYDQTSANTGVYLKADGVVLASETGIVKGDYTLTTEEAVELKKGEQIILQVKASAGDDVHLISFEVNGNYTSCPHEWNNGVCDLCGEACEHSWNDGKCDTCGIACAHKFKDGFCTICEKPCTHDFSTKEGFCTICHWECGRHSWNGDSTCDVCYFECVDHEWGEDSACDICGIECKHTGGEATCVSGAICTACNQVYGDKDPANHGDHGTTLKSNGNGTHSMICNGCHEAVGEAVNCEATNGYFCVCGHDLSVVITEDKFEEVFESVFTGATTEHVANGPDANALNGYEAVEGAKVDGFTYKGFNLEFGADKKTVYLRHHILLDGALTVKVGENDADLKLGSGNYYYFDVEVEIGKFSEAHTITVNGNEVVTASVYSYMKTARESGKLSDNEVNLLNALYDWNVAVANANN